jgi:lysylphosphatidylglycerol synthetase-like protein (DUF2156 family)
MARRKPTSIPPDLFDAIVQETERRLLEQRVLIPADLTETHANTANAYTAAPAHSAPTRARRNTIATRIAFLVIMALVLILSLGFSIAMGLSVAGLFVAFTVLPISAPFFVIGGVVAISLFFLFRFIGRLSGRASEKADYIRAQKKLRAVERT